MATIFLTICDIHEEKGEQVDADAGTVPFGFDRLALEADMCTPCKEAYLALLQPLINVARKAGKVAPPQRRVAPSQPQGGPPSSAYKREEPNSPDGTFVCRAPEFLDGLECDRATSTTDLPGFRDSQGRGMHERRAHGFNLPRVRAWAKAQGKPLDGLKLTEAELAEAHA